MLPAANMPVTITSLFSAYASLTATIMIIRSIVNDVIPPPVRSRLESFTNYLFTTPSKIVTAIIEEQTGMLRNQMYDAAETYLRTKINPKTERFKVSKTQKQKKIQIGLEKGEEIADKFEDIDLKWTYVLIEKESRGQDKRYFELRFQKKYKDRIVNEYLPLILAKSKEIKNNDRSIKLYTRDCGSFEREDGSYGNVWGHINFEHPSNFDTLAMEPEAKNALIDDLDRFVRRRDFYKKIGKAWKRGYLLFGPPGTGKSSLIAAIANYLKFDIYDLELTSVYSNSELRRILVGMTNRSIMVIEDIDCSAETRDRETGPEPDDSDKMTLSGLLNFIDGLWSSCGDEKIIIFTTNRKDRLDPALLRPGRMDVHINMSYCTFNGFKLLASNYLGITDHHKSYRKIEGLMENAEVTPASVAEELMKSDDADVALQGVVDLLERKRKGNTIVEVEGAKRRKTVEVKGVQKGKTENKKRGNNRRKGRKN